MVVFNISEKWSNGIPRTLTKVGFDMPHDPKVELRAGNVRKLVIDGNGNATISGDKARIYCHYKNYNAILTVTVTPHFTGRKDECSLKLRSRHNEPGKECIPKKGKPIDGNKFGGYGFAVGRIEKGGKVKFEWDAKREPTHNCYDQHDSDELPKKLENEKEVKLRHTVKDEGGKVHQIGEIDYLDGNGFHKVMDRFDNSPKSWMVDRDLYEEKSYIWIRNNGSGSITVRDVSLEILP